MAGAVSGSNVFAASFAAETSSAMALIIVDLPKDRRVLMFLMVYEDVAVAGIGENPVT